MADPTSTAARLAEMEAAIAALRAENRELRTRTAALEGAGRERQVATPSIDAGSAPGPGPGPGAAPPDRPGLDRRSALKSGLGLAGAAAAGAVLLDGAPSAAADGQEMIVGRSNSASSSTALYYDSSSTAFYVETGRGTAVVAKATGQGTGLWVTGGFTHMTFGLNSGRVPPIQDTVRHVRGEVVMDAYSNLWYCAGDGTPGVWKTMAGNGSAGSYFPLPTPIRVYDSRPGTVPAQGPKTKLTGTRTIDLKVNSSGVLPFASNVVVNVLLVNATAGAGNFTIWAGGQPKPQSNTLVWGGSAGRFSTLAVSRVDTQARVQLNASLATDVVVDVVGQYY